MSGCQQPVTHADLERFFVVLIFEDRLSFDVAEKFSCWKAMLFEFLQSCSALGSVTVMGSSATALVNEELGIEAGFGGFEPRRPLGRGQDPVLQRGFMVGAAF